MKEAEARISKGGCAFDGNPEREKLGVSVETRPCHKFGRPQLRDHVTSAVPRGLETQKIDGRDEHSVTAEHPACRADLQ